MSKSKYPKPFNADKKAIDLPVLARPEKWRFVIQEHVADKAGRHYDVRVIDPKGKIAYSWAARRLPANGQITGAFRQPDHSVASAEFEGSIPEGYGKGEVRKIMDADADILYSGPQKMRLAIHKGKRTDELIFIKGKDRDVADSWMLRNITPTRSKLNIPADKPAYKSITEEEANKLIAADNWLAMPKLDGAAVYIRLRPGKQMQVFSYRPPKGNPDELIQHTYRIPQIVGQPIDKLPKGKKEIILRGELYALGEDGKALPSEKISGILNSGVVRSRELQKKQKVRMRLAVFDVESVDGVNLRTTPYSQKLDLLRETSITVPHLDVPVFAISPEHKSELYDQIRADKFPDTSEGLVFWKLDEPAAPRKMKFREQYTGYIKGIFPSTKQGEAGGLQVSWKEHSEPVVRIGTGFSRRQRQDMLARPDQYLGRKISFTGQGVYENKDNPNLSTVRSPSFQHIHMDESDLVDVNTEKRNND